MNRKQKVFILLFVMVVLATVLSACAQSAVDLTEYMEKGEDNLSIVARLVLVMHNWIGSYGMTVIVFTVFLKIVMLPFDIWQQYSMRKSSLKMQEIQPLLDAIDKRYGTNTDRAKQEKQKVQQKQSMSMFASCLPMIVTMVVFLFMFGGLREYATYKNVTNYYKMDSFYQYNLQLARQDIEVDGYYQTAQANGYTRTLDQFRIDVASKGLANTHESLAGITDTKYIGIAQFYLNGGSYEDKGNVVIAEPIKESFLWIQSIWQPDTWDSIMPDYNSFKNTVVLSGADPVRIYELIRTEVLTTAERSWNGLMILPVMSIGLSFLSIFISQKMNNKNKKGDAAETNSQQAMSNKMNMILMPLLMAFFGFMYTGAVAVYMVVNYFISILISLVVRQPVNRLVERNFAKTEEKNQTPKANYKR